MQELKTIEDQIKTSETKDVNVLGEISKASAYPIMEGRILAQQTEESAASQIYDELRSSYDSLLEQISPETEDREYNEVG